MVLLSLSQPVLYAVLSGLQGEKLSLLFGLRSTLRI